MSSQHSSYYYVPEPSGWPIVGSLGLFLFFVGAANWLHNKWYGPYVLLAGLAIVVYMIFGWFGRVIRESESGTYNLRVDRSFRWGMFWFIFSEVMFFGAFFGALFYARYVVVPQLGGEYGSNFTNYLLWPDFKASWPVLTNPDNYKFLAPAEAMGAWGIPALNTLILLSSGVTITWAHWGLKKNLRGHLILGLMFTILLGVIFLVMQANEYVHAYHELGLQLDSGIYGTTFFMLTGFHGLHVTIGTIMLLVMLCRSLKGHFTPDRHFAFEAVSWYWHFVDVVWLFLFVFVYWL